MLVSGYGHLDLVLVRLPPQLAALHNNLVTTLQLLAYLVVASSTLHLVEAGQGTQSSASAHSLLSHFFEAQVFVDFAYLYYGVASDSAGYSTGASLQPYPLVSRRQPCLLLHWLHELLQLTSQSTFVRPPQTATSHIPVAASTSAPGTLGVCPWPPQPT